MQNKNARKLGQMKTTVKSYATNNEHYNMEMTPTENDHKVKMTRNKINDNEYTTSI